jgi:peptidoglycan-N-acetylglucosamine deacetylase
MDASPSADDPRQHERRRERRQAHTVRRRARRRRRGLGTLLVALALAALAAALAGGGGHGKGTRSARAAASGRAHRRARGASRAAGAQEAVETAQIRHLIALGRPIYCAAPRGDEVALTFDDGPGQYTWLAVPKLRKHRIKATFFIVGRNIPLRPRALREERALGSVGDHTFSHPLLTGLAPAEAEAQIVRTQRAVERVSGGPVFLFRPPYGARDATIDSIARAHGLLQIMWTVDSRDSLGADYAEIERNVIDGLRPGSIVLMHENHGQTIRAMLGIFAAIERRHLRTVSVARLLSDDPPSDAQVRAGGAGCGSLYRPGASGG